MAHKTKSRKQAESNASKRHQDCRSMTQPQQKIFLPAVLLGLIIILVSAYSLLPTKFNIELPSLDENVSVALLFIMGLLTGFHCIAMCGGFVISYSVKDGETQPALKSHLSYGFAKTFSYTVIGAAFGLIGSFITFTPLLRGAAAIVAGVFLTLLGFNMLGMLRWFRTFRLKTPAFIEGALSPQDNRRPVTVGLLNGLMLACGPLQAIYLLAASTAACIMEHSISSPSA